MTRLFFRFGVWLLLVLTFTSCGDGSGRSRKKPERSKEISLPSRGSKVAFIFPAGAGAMRTILGITEKIESDLGLKNLGEIVDVAGGVSSGSLVAAAITMNVPSGKLKADTGKLVRSVFPETNDFIDELVKDYKFSVHELEAIFQEVLKNLPDLSSEAAAENSFQSILNKAGQEKISIVQKINARGGPGAFSGAVGPQLKKMINKEATRAAALKNAIVRILDDVPMSDKKCAKLIAFATGEKKPVFFGPSNFAKLVKGPIAEGDTKLHDALIASSSIPNFIKASSTINFMMPDGSTKNIPDLSDGFFATEGRFDPSATFYDIFAELFAGEDAIIVYVGNGAPYDIAFRSKLRSATGIRKGISQKVLAGGKKLTFVALDTKITDGTEDSDFFNLSGFYDSDELARYMDDAAARATKSDNYTYDWLIKALKAAIR